MSAGRPAAGRASTVGVVLAGLAGGATGALASLLTALGSAETTALAGGGFFGPLGIVTLAPPWTAAIGALVTALVVLGLLALSQLFTRRRAFWAGFTLVVAAAFVVSAAFLPDAVVPSRTEVEVWVAAQLGKSPLAALLVLIGVVQTVRARPAPLA